MYYFSSCRASFKSSGGTGSFKGKLLSEEIVEVGDEEPPLKMMKVAKPALVSQKVT
jgi:hypothetical protein